MNVTELRQALKQARTVYGWVNIWGDDGAYMQLTKSTVLDSLKGFDRKESTEARWSGDRNGDLYIN